MSHLIYKHWMMFVDGENLTIQAQKVTASRGRKMVVNPPSYLEGSFLWFRNGQAKVARFQTVPRLAESALRAYYYTSVVGADPDTQKVKERLRDMDFNPEVFKKFKGEARPKGVDIALTKDMLSHAFRDNYEIAVLVAGDGDYLPVIEEVKRLGKLVYVWFFEDGLHPSVKLAADHFTDLTNPLLDECSYKP